MDSDISLVGEVSGATVVEDMIKFGVPIGRQRSGKSTMLDYTRQVFAECSAAMMGEEE